MIHLKREERDKGLLKVLQDEKQSFEEWFQDQQLSVNECFENPESTANVETTIQRLTGFLKSTDPERRLDQLRDQVNRGQKQIPDQNLVEISDFIREQQEEVDTFRTHCQNRLLQMEELLGLLHSLQKQHNSFSEWLQMKEKQALDPERLRNLLKELQDANARVSALSDLLSSVRRQGVRGDSLLKDTDNLLQRFKNLETRVQDQVQTQDQIQENLNRFKSKTDETRKWIKELLEPISFEQTESEPEEVKRRAQTMLKSKPEGDSKLEDLRLQSQTLLDQDLDQKQRLEIQQCIRDTEESWRSALDRTEDALKTADTRVQTKTQTRAQLDRDLGEFRDQTDAVQTWISEQEDQLQSLRLLPVTERVQVAQNQTLDDSQRRAVEDAVKETEEQWSGVSRAAEKALNVAQGEAAVQRDFEAFRDQWEKLQTWIREQKQKIMSIPALGTFEERLQLAQSVLNSRPEGDSKLRDLSRQAQSLVQSPDLDLPLRAEVERMVLDTEQQWRTVLQTATQAELKSLSDDFENQSQSTQSWIRERQQLLHSVGAQAPPHQRIDTCTGMKKEAVLNTKPDGDCKVNNLRRRGQNLSDHRDLSDSRRQQLQQTVKDTEEQWRNLLQNAKQVQSTAEEQAREEEESKRKQLKEFVSQKEETRLFLRDLQQKLSSVKEQPTAEDRLHTAQAILSSKAEGDSKLQELRRRGQSLRPDLDEQTRSDASRTVEEMEGQWTELLQDVRQILGQSERQCALENLMKEYNQTKEKTTAWVQEKEDRVKSVGVNTEPEQTINTAQMILSSKPEGDSKLSDLRRQTQSLLDRDDVDEDTRHQADRVLTEAEYQWRDVLQKAEEMLKRAQDQYTVHREMDAFRAQATSTESWVQDLRRQQEEKGTGATGTQAEIEQRLNTAQMVLGCRLNGDSQMVELKTRVQSLSENPDLDQEQRDEIQRRVRDTEETWRQVLQTAEQNQSSLQGVLERLVSCQKQRSQLSSRLSELQTQTSDLPRVFPWPGLGERRQTADQTRNMIDQISALAPLLRDTRTQAAELAELTQDPSWTSSNWDEMEQCIPDLLKKLTESLSSLEEGILAERQCTQLMEQHEAAQDWLREQVKALGPAPQDKQGLHSAINTLKALLQTVHREQREMLELDQARDRLLNLCTPGGQDALNLDVSHLHDLCATSEQEVKQHLTSCEARVEELERQVEQRAEGLKERTSALQWELRSLDQALSYSQPQNNISQLQQHWNSLKNCEKSLEGLRVKLDELLKEVASAPQTEELPTDVTTLVKSLSQQHDSLKSRLSDHQSSCSTNADRCFKDCLQNLQKWNSRETPESSDSLQESLEEGEKYKLDLQEALSHWQFLSDCLSPLVFGKLDQESSETLAKADIQKNNFNKKKEELDARPKFKPTVAQMSSEMSLVAPPRKKRSQMTPAASMQSINQSAEEDEKQINVIEPMEVESVVCDISQRMEESMIWEKVKTIKEDSGTEMETSLPIEKMVVDTKEVKEPTTQAASQETPVPLRRRSKMVTTEPETKQIKIETQIPQPIQQESLETKKISTIILDNSQSFIIPSETGSKMEDIITEEQVKTRPEDISTLEDAVPPKRKPKSPKIQPKETKSSVTTDAVVVPVRKKSKSTPPTEIFIEGSKEESVQETAKLSPTKKRSKKSKSSPEIAPKEVKMSEAIEETKPFEMEEAKVDQEHKETVEEPKLVVPRRKTKMAEFQQKTSQEIYASSESVNIPEVSENGKLTPPKRKPKSPKASPAIVKKDMPKEDTELDSQSISLDQDLDSWKTTQPATEPITAAEVSTEKSIEEKGTLSPTKRKPKGKPKLSPELPKKEVDETKDEPKTERSPTETTVLEISSLSKEDTELDSQNISSIQDLDSQKTTQFATEAIIEMPIVVADISTEKSMDENGTLSPTKRKSKGKPKISPELPKKEEEETKEESNTETFPTEMSALELSKDSGLSPPKRRSKKSKISSELSKKEVDETKIQAPSVVETTASVSPPKRKSKGKKIKSQDSSEESPIDVPTDPVDEFKKLATIVLEMPGTVPQTIFKETIFKPKQDTPTERVVELSETPSKEAKKAQKGEVQTTTESMRPVSTKAALEFVSSGEMEEKKVATIVLEMPESDDQPQVSTKPDTIQSMDTTDNVETEVAKDLREVPEDVPMQQQETKMRTEDDTVTNIVTISEPVVRMDVSLPIAETEEKKVAILVLEMPQELPITETKSVDKDSEDQPIKEQTSKPMEDLAVEEPKQIDIQPMKPDAKDISVCKAVKDQIDALAKIEESKVATIILEMPDSTVPKTETNLETKPEQAPRNEEKMNISATPDVTEKEDIKITPLSKKSTGEVEPMQDKYTITMPVSKEIDLPATQEEPLIQEAEIQTIIQETGPAVEDTKVEDAETIQQKFDSFDEVHLQPESTNDASDSVGNEDKKGLVSDKQQDSIDVMEKVSKPEQVTQMASEDVVLPKEVDTRENGISSVSDTVVLGDADSIEVALETSEIIAQPGQNVKEVSEIKEGKGVIQEVKPMQTVEIQPSVDETKDIVKDSDHSKLPQKVDDIAMKPGQDVKKVPVVFTDKAKVQKEQDLLAEPQITSETVNMEDSESQPSEESVVAEETVVEYISIIRKPIVEDSEEDKMAAKKPDITPETRYCPLMPRMLLKKCM
ncbi:nesprin-2-like [Boleophthalmus pectinirostris]|uniref:nesprin-2-like n=1 Tax=Boleophthalmus pectinirostris TaxID=150288 RepID=UPI002431EA62|nr:nesprin-2-like [Boleophthalmus pectinirostris]